MIITRRRGISQAITPSVPALPFRGLFGGINGTQNPGPTELVWPDLAPSYSLGPPALPGHAAFGMDSRGGGGRHLPTPLTSIVFVTNLNTGNVGSALSGLGVNVFGGTWEYAWRHVASPKCIIPLVSGWIPINDNPNSPLAGNYISYWGQFAPAPGLVLRGANPRLNGGSDCQIWHVRSYHGDEGPIDGYPVSVRDCFAHGNATLTPIRNLFINCDFAWGVDELLDSFYGFDGMSMLYCDFLEPLHAPPNLGHPEDPVNTDHGFGPIVGGGAQPNRFSTIRNRWAHTTGRNPLTSARAFTHSNNLHYNHGRPAGGSGNGVHWHATNSAAMEANIIGNLFVRGPNNNNNMVAASCDVAVNPASGAFMDLNSQHGWSAPSAQTGFMTNSPGGFVKSAYLPGALPTAFGDGALDGVLRWAANPLAPTTAELNNFAVLMNDSCGAQPGYRSLTNGRGQAIHNQILARFAGNTSPLSQFVNTVLQAGGFFPLAEVVVNPLSPGVHWHAPLPTGADRDQILGSGTLLNGKSAAPYTRLEAWALNQHYFVGGK